MEINNYKMQKVYCKQRTRLLYKHLTLHKKGMQIIIQRLTQININPNATVKFKE